MIALNQIATASLNQLTAELAAAGWDSTQTETYAARDAVARLLDEMVGPFDLNDSETNETIRESTADEVAESVNAGPEWHILVDGRKCYVAE